MVRQFIYKKETTETSAEFNIDGAVKLRFDNSTKFETTATGIDVTGTVTADGLTVDNAQYINFKNSSNVSTRSLGINVANTFYIGGIDADIGDILFVDGGAGNAVIDGGATDNTVLTLDSGTANTYLKITDSNSTNGTFIGATTNDLNFYP
jgi:hypothetical protein